MKSKNVKGTKMMIDEGVDIGEQLIAIKQAFKIATI
jgi:hypothetical protein